MAKRVITKEQVRKYNEMVKASIGTPVYEKVALPREFKDDSGRWISNPYNYLYPINEYEDSWGAVYFIRTINDVPYIYVYMDDEPTDRLCLANCEIAKLFFGI